MAANPNVGTEAQPGAEGTPSQPVSPQAQPPIESDVTKLLASLESKFSERFQSLENNLTGLKKIQSDIDRSQNAFQQQLARLTQYESQGLTREEAIAEMQSDDMAEQRWTNLEKKLDDLAARFAGAGTQANGQQAVTKVFEAIGLDTKDPRVASALLTQYKTAEEVELAAYRLQRQIQQSPNPNPAQNASLQGGGAQAGSEEALLAKLKDLQKEPVRNRKEIIEVKKQLGW